MSRLEVARAEVKRLQAENSRLRQARSEPASDEVQRQLEDTRECLRRQDIELQELRTKCQLLEETCKTVREEAARQRTEHELERHRAVEAERAKWEERESRMVAQLDAARRPADVEKRETAETPTQSSPKAITPGRTPPKKPRRVSSLSEMRPVSETSLSLQEAIKAAPTVDEEERSRTASANYCNLSMGGHNYLNFEQAKQNTDVQSNDDVQYVRLPQLVADPEARKSLIRTPHEREVTEEEKAFMKDTWGVKTEGGTTFAEVVPEMRFSLGDLETDLVQRYVTKQGESNTDEDVFAGGCISERGRTARERGSSAKEDDTSNNKFKSRLLRHSSDSVLMQFDQYVNIGKLDKSKDGV